MPRPIPTFCGEIVTLRPICAECDARDYFEFNLDQEMHRWTNNSPFASLDEARAELSRLRDSPDVSTWMIVDNRSSKVVGRFFLCLEERAGRRIVGEGNRIARPYWRQGHNREARRYMFDYAFGSLRADAYETACWAGNVNSCRSIESHGFLLVDEAEEIFGKLQQKMVMRHYRMTREQWRTSAR
jgi:ribosomal-protein-alanine N-acetyltransferase